MMDADGKETVTHREMVLTFDRVVNEVKHAMAQQRREDEFVGCKVRQHYYHYHSRRKLNLYISSLR